MIWILFFLLLIAVPAITDTELCLDLVRQLKIDRFSTTLEIDELIHARHLRHSDWDFTLVNTHDNRTYTADLSCFENLRVIADLKERWAKHIQLKKFTTQTIDSTSGYLIVEYSLRQLNKTNFTALFLVKNVENIASLHLKHNQLTEIPERSLVLLRNLTNLTIASNVDRIIGQNELAFNLKLSLSKDSFYGLDQLTHLDLSMNPPISGDLSCLCRLPQLVFLDLAFTYAPQMYAFPMRCIEKLQFLYMPRKEDDAIQSVDLQSFEKWPALEILDLSGVKLEFLHKQMFKSPNLKELKLESYEDLQGAFKYLKTLERLDMSRKTAWVHFNNNNLKKLIFEGLIGLKVLTINSYSVLLWDVEADVFKHTPNLTHLDLSYNRLGTDVLKCLLPLNRTLESLNLANNNMEIFESSLIKNFYLLKELHLSKNYQVNLNVSLFSSLKQLKSLFLSSDSIDRLTIRSFEGLAELEKLDLSENFIQIIENGTFTLLAKLASLDLRRNNLKNLFFYGLSNQCNIFLDGLVVFNISRIDLKQMTSGRQESFLLKKMSRKNSSISIFRNIKVNWESSYPRPNCSLYLHVLRHFKPISFELDEAYLDECLSENLIFNSERWAFPLHQIRTHEDIKPNEFSFQTRFSAFFQDDSVYLGTADGFLIGVNYRLRQLFSVKSNGTSIANYTFEIDYNMKNFRFECNNVLFSKTPRKVVYWNMTDKTRIWRFIELNTEKLRFCVVADVLVKLNSELKILYIGSNINDLRELERNVKGTKLESAKHFLIMDDDATSLVLWNLKSEPIFRKEIKTNLDNRVYSIKYGFDGYVYTLTDINSVQLWKLEVDHLKFLWNRYSRGNFLYTRFFKMDNIDDVFLSFYYTEKKELDIWSGRFGKKISELQFPDKGLGQIFYSDVDSTVFCYYLFDGEDIWFF